MLGMFGIGVMELLILGLICVAPVLVLVVVLVVVLGRKRD